jgi:thymidylate synthase ThyX
MAQKRQVYLLDPQKLSPETIAVTFAKTSRSPDSFREIAAELTEDKSAEFHEKWVLGYGHSSVAEHAVLHIAVENISRLAVESLESNRLASYTEKSTRYQKWDADAFYIPDELTDHVLKPKYLETCQLLFDTYLQSLAPVKEVIKQELPQQQGEKESAWDRRIRPEITDVCRFILPACALANVGVTINARTLEHAIQKMLSHPLAEVRSIGREIKQVAQTEVPTLVKYADEIPYLKTVAQNFSLACAQANLPVGNIDWCQLISSDFEGENQVLAAALYRFGQCGYAQALDFVRSAPFSQRQVLADMLLLNLGKFDIPLRELEHARFTFDLVLDQGAYNEFKRHRMMTQTPQSLTARLGYAIPRRISTAGFEKTYRSVMETALSVYEQITAFNPDVAAYLVPNAFNRRVLCSFNLREAFQLLSLRSAENAHFSIRRIARRMAEQIQASSPLLGQYLRLPPGETWQEIEIQHFIDTCVTG